MVACQFSTVSDFISTVELLALHSLQQLKCPLNTAQENLGQGKRSLK